MARRPKGKPGAMTRRDPEAKRARRAERAKERADEAAAEPKKTEPKKTEPKKTEPKKTEPKKTEPKKTEPKKTEPKKTEPKKTEPKKTEPKKAEPLAEVDEARAEEADALELRGEAWGFPLARFEHRWTWLETRMLALALGALVLTLCIWLGIRGMKDPVETGSPAGTLWRAIVGMSAFGGLTRFATGRVGWDERRRTVVTTVAVLAGALLAKSWRTVGIDYFGNLLDWLQQGSSIALFGGLKGISTRLTMLVALIGASLACSTGTHINIDVVVRFIPQSWRKSAHIASILGASVVCLVSSWGFLDFIAVSGFKASPDAAAGEKVAHVVHELGDHNFALRKQLGLDLDALPGVLQGRKWNADERMNGAQWNEFLDRGGFVERFGAEDVQPLRAGADELQLPRRPFVVLPHELAAGVLIHDMDLLFPVGFLMIGLRMLLRVMMVLSGQISLDEESDSEESDGDDDRAESDDVEEGEVA